MDETVKIGSDLTNQLSRRTARKQWPTMPLRYESRNKLQVAGR